MIDFGNEERLKPERLTKADEDLMATQPILSNQIAFQSFKKGLEDGSVLQDQRMNCGPAIQELLTEAPNLANLKVLEVTDGIYIVEDPPDVRELLEVLQELEATQPAPKEAANPPPPVPAADKADDPPPAAAAAAAPPPDANNAAAMLLIQQQMEALQKQLAALKQVGRTTIHRETR